ncbi:MAG: ABC transporter substrate-binding protein [Bacillota bacterium]|nr:ABC transporter substrate-binding protein [Bacillota bacterium]
MLTHVRKACIVLSLVLVFVFAFSACGTKPLPWDGKTLRIGVDDSYPPMEFRDDKNALVGFDVDMAKAIAQKLGVPIKWTSIVFTGIFAGLDTNKYDIIISSVSMTKSREKKYLFSEPYLSNGQEIVVAPSNNSITKIEDLKGKKVGVQSGTTAENSAKKYNKKFKFTIVPYDQIIQPFADLKTGRLDAVVSDAMVAEDYAAKDAKSYKISGVKMTNEPIAICMTKVNTDLQTKINKALDELRADGTLKKISEKWYFGKDATSNIDTSVTED